jgi:hypothetical protein
MLRCRSAGMSRRYDRPTSGTTSLIVANVSKMLETPTLTKYPPWIAFSGHLTTSSPKLEASGSFYLITDSRRRILHLPPRNVSSSRLSTPRLVRRMGRNRSPDFRGKRNVLSQLRKPRPRIRHRRHRGRRNHSYLSGKNYLLTVNLRTMSVLTWHRSRKLRRESTTVQ